MKPTFAHGFFLFTVAVVILLGYILLLFLLPKQQAAVGCNGVVCPSIYALDERYAFNVPEFACPVIGVQIHNSSDQSYWGCKSYATFISEQFIEPYFSLQF